MYFPLSGWEGKGPAWAEMLKEPIHQLIISDIYTASCGIQQPFGPTALDIHSPVLHGLYTDLYSSYIVKRPGAMHYYIQGVAGTGEL